MLTININLQCNRRMNIYIYIYEYLISFFCSSTFFILCSHNTFLSFVQIRAIPKASAHEGLSLPGGWNSFSF